MILRLRLHGEHVVALVVDLGEEGLLLLGGVEVVGQVLERRRDDDLVELLDLAVDGDADLAVLPLDLRDIAVQAGLVQEMVVELLPDPLRAVLPGPEVALDEVHRGLEVQIFQDVGRRDLVEIAVAEGREGADPDVLHELDAVDLAELVERKGQVLQVGVDAGDLLALRGDGVAVVAAFGDAAVAVDVVAFIFGLQELAEAGDLLLHLQQTGDLREVLRGLEGLDDLAVHVLVVAVQLRAVVGDAAELLDVVDRVVGRDAHDRAHLVAPPVVVRGVALAAHMVVPLEDGVILVALLLEVHGRGETRRAAADDTDPVRYVAHNGDPFLNDAVRALHTCAEPEKLFLKEVAKTSLIP